MLDAPRPAPGLQFALTVAVDLDAKIVGPATTRGMGFGQVSVRGGSFSGPRVRGRVRPGGWDSPDIHADGVPSFHAVYFLHADDGTLIRLANRGLRVADAQTEALFAAGRHVDAEAYQLIATPVFDVPEGPHAWLSRGVFVGLGRRHPRGNVFDYYRVA
jgi:hypothetical protein